MANDTTDDTAAPDDDSSLIEFLAKVVSGPNGQQAAPLLYAAVAELIRSRLPPSDAAIVAEWFDALRAGADPTKVFIVTSQGGRQSRLDRDLDIAWWVHRLLLNDPKMSTDDACRRVAKDFGRLLTNNKSLNWKSIRNIHSKHRAQIEKAMPRPEPEEPKPIDP